MNAIILCPGPSLAGFDPGDFCGLLVAVNRAAVSVGSDVWACGDHPLIQQERGNVRGNPVLFTTCNAVTVLAKEPWPNGYTLFESLQQMSPPDLWDTFTLTAALVYAASAGADQIDIYGADWSGKSDFDGIAAGGNRSTDRWKLERELFTNRMLPWLEAHGININRVEA